MLTRNYHTTTRQRVLPLLIFTILTSCFYAASLTDRPTRKQTEEANTAASAARYLFNYQNL